MAQENNTQINPQSQMVEVEEKTIQAVVNYLSERPWREAHPLISALSRAKKVEAK